MVSDLLKKYIWLIDIFVRKGDEGIILNDIQDAYKSKWNEEYTRRTFNNHREAIEDVFGIKIECRRSDYHYFVKYSSSIANQKDTTSWIINSFSLNSVLMTNGERLSGRVSLENIPSGQKWLAKIMSAMRDNKIIRLGYKKYVASEVDHWTIRPYAVKEDGRRWYLIGWCEEKKSLRIYSLDRFDYMEETNKTFKMPENFDVDETFSTSYSIYLTNDKACTIQIRAFGTEANYLQDLPIHKSQTIIGSGTTDDGKPYTDFSIFVVPDTKLIMDLCGKIDQIEVISPESVRNQVAESLSKALEHYK